MIKEHSFVFLEILDPDANALLWSIREALHGSTRPRPVHLTLRGPYEDGVPEEVLELCRATLKQDVVRIGGVGRFTNPGEEVVYFGVDSPHLREVWWKRDFPIERFGFEPHVSVYRGADAAFADAAAEFLRHERIELLVAEHRVVSHPQLQLFQAPQIARSIPNDQAGRRFVSPSFLPRLRHFVQDYDRQAQLS